jgi:hypothetical protein
MAFLGAFHDSRVHMRQNASIADFEEDDRPWAMHIRGDVRTIMDRIRDLCTNGCWSEPGGAGAYLTPDQLSILLRDKSTVERVFLYGRAKEFQ